MKLLIMMTALFLITCTNRPIPRTVCTVTTDSDCEDICVAKSSFSVDGCIEECKHEVCK